MFKDFSNQQEFVSFRTEGRTYKHWWVIGGCAFLVAFVVGAAYMALYSSVFTVTSFQLTESALLHRESFLKSVQEQMFGSWWRGVFGPDNILFWALGDMPKFTNTAVPYAAALSFAADITSRRVSFTVEERKLFAVWCVEEATCYGVDRNGVAFVKAPRLEGSLIFKIEDTNHRPVVLGGRVFQKTEWFQTIVRGLEALKAANLPATAIRIRDVELQEWEVKISSKTTLYFSLNHLPSNLRTVLRSVSNRTTLANLEYLDFRVPNRIYYK